MSRLIYLPLGGAGEVGMNMYVYGYGERGRERLIVVDAGITFSHMESSPGVDLIMPDFRWLLERKSRIEAIFLTHGHQDHVGALPFIVQEIRAPVFAQAFSMEIASDRLFEMIEDFDGLQVVGTYPKSTRAGPFEVSFLPVSHSIPESAGLLIDSPAGRIIHSGDFKIDDQPVVGQAFDEELWKDVSDCGVAALMCDSTNVFVEGHGRSESAIGQNLRNLFSGCDGMIVATTFASHVARLKQMALAAEACERSIVLVGRSMCRTVQAATETGLFAGFSNLASIEEARKLPRNKLVLLATGSQGEMRAATSQLSSGRPFKGLRVQPGDMVVYSSRTIPGNELSVNRIINRFARLGVEVVDDASRRYHVSGHPNRMDLTKLHKIVDPYLIVPIHGEFRHLAEHARLARKNGFKSIVSENGCLIDLLRQELISNESIEAGRKYWDGKCLIGSRDGVVRDRLRMAREGFLTMSVLLNGKTIGPEQIAVTGSGLPLIEASGFKRELSSALVSHLLTMKKKNLKSNKMVVSELERVAGKSCWRLLGKRPLMSVSVHRV